MKRWMDLSLALAMTTLAAAASAQTCPTGTSRLNHTQIAAAFGNKTLCAAKGSETWQEFHDGNTTAGGALIDYKRGSNDPVDPTKQVGNWRVSGTGNTALLVHDYGSSGGVYSWAVCGPQAANPPFRLISTGASGEFTGVTPKDGLVKC